MLAEEVMLFGLLGALTSLTIGFVVTEGKNISVSIAALLVFQGGFTGWIAGVIWVYVTGGLEITLFSLVMPIFISGFFAILLLGKAQVSIQRANPKTSNIAVVMLFVLALVVAWSSVPVAYDGDFNTQTFSVGPLDWSSSETVIEETFEPTMPVSLSIPMEIDNVGSSTDIGVMSETPLLNSYYDFKVTFRPKADWQQPYVKIGIYEDTNKDGIINDGDILWSDTQYKIGIDQTSNWRVNCLWENGMPKYNVHSSDGGLLPVFHAKSISPSVDETGKYFLNTPEGYKIQKDMMTWDEQGLKDTPLEYASIKSGEQSTITGRIYCSPDSIGNHIILVETYDARTGDPFSDVQPLQEKTFPITITNVKEQTTIFGIPNLAVLALLGIITFVAIIYAKKEGLIR